MKKIFFIFFALCVLLSCKKTTAPQLPSNKATVEDKDVLNLLEINQTLANKEDSLLQVYVSAIDSVFVKDDIGFWYRIYKHTSGKSIKEKDNVMVAYQLFSLEEEYLDADTVQVEIGKKQLPVALEEMVKRMKRGEEALVISPWYLAYGMKGNQTVAPYTSVLYRVLVD